MVFETAIFSNKFNVNGSVVAEQVSKGAFVLGRCDITLCGGHIFFYPNALLTQGGGGTSALE